MAKRIGLIEPQGQVPSTYIKKSAAQLLVRRLLAKWEGDAVRLVDVRQMDRAIPARFIIPEKPYIPEILPPAELPGVLFVPPVKPLWQNSYSPDACS